MIKNLFNSSALSKLLVVLILTTPLPSYTQGISTEELNYSQITRNPSKNVQDIITHAKIGSFQHKNTGIDIKEIAPYQDGIQVRIQAWDNDGQQFGFSPDGSIETETLRIFNPPVLVDDPSGTIILNGFGKNEQPTQRRMRYDPELALKDIITNYVRDIGKKGSDIIEGSVGRTTYTFYPQVDGRTQRISGGESWASIITGDGTAFADSDTNRNCVGAGATTTTNQYDSLIHCFFKFDTSSLPDGLIFDSAQLSTYVVSKDSALGGSVSVVSGVVASTTNLAATDHVNHGTTKLATDALVSTLSTGAYKDFILNGSGIANISTSGFSTFAFIMAEELAGSPTWVSNGSSVVEIRLVEFTGTTSDPYLLVIGHEVTCGDGLIEGSEACDDGDTTSGDGCSNICAIESGYSCVGEPSVCTAISSSASSAISSSSSSLITGTGSNIFGTGSLIWGSTYCGEYEMVDGSGTTICAEWIHTIDKAALAYAFSSDIQITFSALLYVLFIATVFFIFLFVVCKFFFELLIRKYAREKDLFSTRKLK